MGFVFVREAALTSKGQRKMKQRKALVFSRISSLKMPFSCFSFFLFPLLVLEDRDFEIPLLQSSLRAIVSLNNIGLSMGLTGPGQSPRLGPHENSQAQVWSMAH